jgi:hypothetical protein
LPIAHETSILEDGINFFILNMHLQIFKKEESIPPRNHSMAELIPPEESMARNRLPVGNNFLKYLWWSFRTTNGARNRVGIFRVVVSARARLHRLVESIPWNQFLGSLKA